MKAVALLSSMFLWLVLAGATFAQERSNGYILIDISGSMDSDHDPQGVRWDAICTYLKLLSLSKENGLGGRFFSDRDESAFALDRADRNSDSLCTKLPDLARGGGGTNLYPSLQSSLKKLEGKRGIRYLIVLSDGERGDAGEKNTKAIEKFQRDHGPLLFFFVCLHKSGLNPRAHGDLLQACQRTGGQAYHIDTKRGAAKDELLSVFLDIFKRISPATFALLTSQQGEFELNPANRSFVAVNRRGQKITVEDPTSGLVVDREQPFRRNVQYKHWNVVLAERPTPDHIPGTWSVPGGWKASFEKRPLADAEVYVHSDVDIGFSPAAFRASAGSAAMLEVELTTSSLEEWLPNTTEAEFLQDAFVEVEIFPEGQLVASARGELVHSGGRKFRGRVKGLLRPGPHFANLRALHRRHSVGVLAQLEAIGFPVAPAQFTSYVELEQAGAWTRLPVDANGIARQELAAGTRVRFCLETGLRKDGSMLSVEGVVDVQGPDGRKEQRELERTVDGNKVMLKTRPWALTLAGRYEASFTVSGTETVIINNARRTSEFEEQLACPDVVVTRPPFPDLPLGDEVSVEVKSGGRGPWSALPESSEVRLGDHVRYKVRLPVGLNSPNPQGLLSRDFAQITLSVTTPGGTRDMDLSLEERDAEGAVYASAPIEIMDEGTFEGRALVTGTESFAAAGPAGLPLHRALKASFVLPEFFSGREPGTTFTITWESQRGFSFGLDEDIYLKGKVTVDASPDRVKSITRELLSQLLIDVESQGEVLATLSPRTEDLGIDLGVDGGVRFTARYQGEKSVGQCTIRVRPEVQGVEQPVRVDSASRTLIIGQRLLDVTVLGVHEGNKLTVHEGGVQLAEIFEDYELSVVVEPTDALRARGIGDYQRPPEVTLKPCANGALPGVVEQNLIYRTESVKCAPGGVDLEVRVQIDPTTLARRKVRLDVGGVGTPALVWQSAPKDTYSQWEVAKLRGSVSFDRGDPAQWKKWQQPLEISGELIIEGHPTQALAVRPIQAEELLTCELELPNHIVGIGQVVLTLTRRGVDGIVEDLSRLTRQIEVRRSHLTFRIYQGSALLIDSDRPEAALGSASSAAPLRLEVSKVEGLDLDVGSVTVQFGPEAKPISLERAEDRSMGRMETLEEGEYEPHFRAVVNPGLGEDPITLAWQAPPLAVKTPHRPPWLLIAVGLGLAFGGYSVWALRGGSDSGLPLMQYEYTLTSFEGDSSSASGSVENTSFLARLLSAGRLARRLRLGKGGRLPLPAGEAAFVEFEIQSSDTGSACLVLSGRASAQDQVEVTGHINARFPGADSVPPLDLSQLAPAFFTIACTQGTTSINLTFRKA